MATYERLDYGSDDGCQIGGAATDKVGFYGATPIARRAATAQATFTITIGTSETAWGFKTSDQFNAFVAQMREIQDTLIALGVWKGSA